MEKLIDHKESKSGLLDDMVSFIRYTPDREADILAFMEKPILRSLWEVMAVWFLRMIQH